MKQLKYILLCLATTFAITYGYQEENEKIKIAILQIENRTSTSVDTQALTDSLQIEIVKKKYYLVVERNQLNKILEEQKLSLSGLTETEQVTKIGQLLGAQKIWIGSLSKFGEKYVLSMKSVDVQSGVIDFADQVYAYDSESILDTIPDLADRMIMLAKGKQVPGYQPKKKFTPKNTYATENQGVKTTYSKKRPNSSIEIGFYGVIFNSTNNVDNVGRALSIMLKDPADKHFEFYLETRFYSGLVTYEVILSGFNLNSGFYLNLIANGYILLGGNIGFGIDVPSFSINDEYKISCFEWTFPLGLQFGIHLGKNFMFTLETGYVLGFGLSIIENDYSTSKEGKYITIDGESQYIPLNLEKMLKDGINYGYIGARLSFLY